MKKHFTLYFFAFVFLGITQNVFAQQTVDIGPTSGSSSYYYGPYYRSSSSSSYDYSAYAYLYTATELNIPPGALITKVAWLKSSGTISGNNTFKVRMENNSATTLSSTTYGTLMATGTEVYSTTTQSFMAGSDAYEEFTFASPFLYTGGSLEIITDHVMNGTASGANDYYYETATGMAIGWASGSAPTASTTIGSSSSYSNRRPTIRITYKLTAGNNAGISELSSPLNFCPGTEDIKVKVLNAGINVIDSVKIGWTLDGVAQTPYSLTQPLDTFGGSGLMEREVTLGTHTFTTAPVNFKAWTYLPNGVADTSNSNDTISLVLHSSLSGTFTIDAGSAASATNYQSFSAFITDLEQYGVCGPVTANVVSGSGPYSEVVSIGDITGASATNTIRINGNGETVQYTNTSTERQLLTLDGAKYVIIDSLKFKAQDATYGWGALITNGSEYDSIMRCEFDLSSVTSTSSANSSGIIFSASATSATSSGANGKHCYIGYNHLKGTTGSGSCYYGITVVGASDSNVIDHNLLENFYYYGIYVNAASGTKVLYNDVNRATKTSVTTYYGIYTTGATPGTHIVGNRFHAPGGTNGSTGTCYAMYLSGDGDANDPVLVANNAAYDLNQGGILRGIYLSTAPHNLVYNNTINIDQTLSSSSTNYGIYATGTNTGTEIKNNNVSITAGGTGTKYGFYYSSAASIDDAQMNNFYVNSTQSGTQNYGYYTSAYATQSAFQTAYPTLEVGSPADDPQFVNASTGDLTPQSMTLIGQGVDLTAWVPEDINGNPRPATPAIGAFEQPPAGGNNAGMLGFVSPEGNFCADSQLVKVEIYNAGINNITSVQVNWSVNGITQTPVTYTGTLVTLTSSTGQNSDTVMLGNAFISNVVPTNIEVWTSLPNGVADSETANDSLSDNFQAPQYSISIASDTVCAGDDAVLELNPDAGYNSGELTWQSSSDGLAWIDIANSDTVSYTESTVSASTLYRVRVGGVGGCYSDTLQVIVMNLTIDSVHDGEHCGPGAVMLEAYGTPGADLKWYESDTSAVPVGTGSSFTTPSLSNSTTYWVSSSIGNGSGSVGPVNPESVGTGAGGYTSSTTYVTYFTVNVPTTITSVDIFPNTTGQSGQIQITDESTGTVVGSYNFTTTTSGSTTNGQTIPINEPLPPGDYSIGMANTSVSMYRNTSGGSYPYSTPEISITGNGFNNTAYYYYFYNMQYSSGCESAKTPVIATILPTPPVTYLGNDTNFCPGNQTITLDAGHPGNTYAWNTGDNTQTITVSDTGNYSVTVTFATGCTSSDMIHIISAPFPSVVLPLTTDLCDGDTAILDAGNSGSTYSWNTGDTSQSIDVTNGGTYTVTVTNSYGCSLDMNTDVTIRPLPVVNLGPDVSFCPGDGMTLDAGNPGGQYLWSTGDTTQIIPAMDSGLYIVNVIAGPYSCSNSDSIHLAFNPLPIIGGITSVRNPDSSFTFAAYGISDFDSTYLWDFGDGHTSTSANPTHAFDQSGDYTIKLILKNDCGPDTFSIQITFTKTGIGQFDIAAAQLKLYPNPAKEWVTLENKSAFKMKSITVYNVLGQVLFRVKVDNPSNYRLNVESLSAGVYSVRVVMENGSWVHRKFEVLK